jgi:hypothetical protein
MAALRYPVLLRLEMFDGESTKQNVCKGRPVVEVGNKAFYRDVSFGRRFARVFPDHALRPSAVVTTVRDDLSKFHAALFVCIGACFPEAQSDQSIPAKNQADAR